MPSKVKTKECQACGEVTAREKLSKSRLCYYCALRRMIKAFDVAWEAKHGQIPRTLTGGNS